MSNTLTSALIAGSGCSLVNAIYHHSSEDLTNDDTYEQVMTAVIHLTYTLTGLRPHASLIMWLIQGQHLGALRELDTAGLLPAEFTPAVRNLTQHSEIVSRSRTDIEDDPISRSYTMNTADLTSEVTR